jgi:hypothetical protein
MEKNDREKNEIMNSKLIDFLIINEKSHIIDH